jgi:hypothetical protein
MTDVRSKPPADPGRGRVRRTAAWLAAASVGNAEGGVYGALLIGILLAAEDSHRETYAETIGAAALVLVVYWLTDLYTHLLGVRLRTKERLARPVIRRTVVHELPVIEGGVLPVAVLVLAWATGATLNDGITAAVVAAVASIVALEIVAASRARPSGAAVWLRAAAGALVGLAIVAVKVVLHV